MDLHEIISSLLLQFHTLAVDSIAHFCGEAHQQWFHHFQPSITQKWFVASCLLSTPSVPISCMAEVQLRKATEGEEAAQRGIGCFGFSFHLEPFPKCGQVISTPLSFRNLKMNNKLEQFKSLQDFFPMSQFLTYFFKNHISLSCVRLFKKSLH